MLAGGSEHILKPLKAPKLEFSVAVKETVVLQDLLVGLVGGRIGIDVEGRRRIELLSVTHDSRGTPDRTEWERERKSLVSSYKQMQNRTLR